MSEYGRGNRLGAGSQKTDSQAAETAFKERLLKLGLLTKIAHPATSPLRPGERPLLSRAMRFPS